MWAYLKRYSLNNIQFMIICDIIFTFSSLHHHHSRVFVRLAPSPHMCDMKNEIFSWRHIFQALCSFLFYVMLNCCLACTMNILLLSYVQLWNVRKCMYAFRLALCSRSWKNYNLNSFNFICVPWHMHHVHKTAFKVSLLMLPFPLCLCVPIFKFEAAFSLHWNFACLVLRRKILFRDELSLLLKKIQSN